MRGKTVVVTGGFGALGSGIAAAAVDCGASVARYDVAPSAPPPSPTVWGRTRFSSAASTCRRPRGRNKRWLPSKRNSGGSTRFSTSPAAFTGKRSRTARPRVSIEHVRAQPEDGAQRLQGRAPLLLENGPPAASSMSARRPALKAAASFWSLRRQQVRRPPVGRKASPRNWN